MSKVVLSCRSHFSSSTETSLKSAPPLTHPWLHWPRESTLTKSGDWQGTGGEEGLLNGFGDRDEPRVTRV